MVADEESEKLPTHLNSTAPGLYAVRADGAGEAKRLTEGKAGEFPTSFSPDGRRQAVIFADDSERRPTHLTFLLNVFDELRRRVSVVD